jgi:hypothetical protein
MFNYVTIKHKQMSFVSNGGKFKLYTVLNGLIFPTPTQPRISFERAMFQLHLLFYSSFWFHSELLFVPTLHYLIFFYSFLITNFFSSSTLFYYHPLFIRDHISSYLHFGYSLFSSLPIVLLQYSSSLNCQHTNSLFQLIST